MDNLIRRNKERAVVEDADEIIRQREARYRAELERMAVDQAARITGLDDRDRRTLQAIREEIRDVKVTVQDTGGAPVTAPAPAYEWRLSFAAPIDGVAYTLLSDAQISWLVPLRVTWRLYASLGASPAAEAVLQAGRLYLDFGDGTASETLPMSPDGGEPYADGAYSGEVDFGSHAYPPGAYTIVVSGGGPLGGAADARTHIAVNDYVAPAQLDYWTWNGASCAAHSAAVVPAGAYLSLAACQAAHPPPVTFWVWDGAACQQQTAPAAPAGSYSTLAACQAAHPPAQALGWAIVDGLCLLVPGGPYATFADCDAVLNPPPLPPPVPSGGYSLVFHDPYPLWGATVGPPNQPGGIYLFKPQAQLDLRIFGGGIEDVPAWFDPKWVVWTFENGPPAIAGPLRTYSYTAGGAIQAEPWYKFFASPGFVAFARGACSVALAIYATSAMAGLVGDWRWYFTVA